MSTIDLLRVICLAVAWCLPGAGLTQPPPAGPPADTDPPLIVHEVVAEAPYGATQRFSATVTDDRRVQTVELHYRLAPDAPFERQPMLSAGAPDRYAAVVEVEEGTLGIDYFIQAEDTAGNGRRRGSSIFPLTRRLTIASSPSPNRRRILYYVLGAVAAGLLANQLIGEEDDDSGCTTTGGCSVTVTVPRP